MEKEILEAISKTTSEINDLLAKSGYLAKNEDEGQEPAPQEGEVPDQAPESEGEPEPQEGEGEAPAPESPQEGEGEAPSGDEDQLIQELKAHAKEMSDEELESMLQILMEEHEMRAGGQAPEGEAPAPEAPQEGAPEMPPPAEKSMKEDMMKLHKSVEALTSVVEKISKDVSEVKAAPKKAPQARPAATNRPVQTLEKSLSKPAPAQRLTKSQTTEFLLEEMRKGNKSVSSGMVAEAHNLDGEALHAYQDQLVAKGINIPRL